MGRTYINYTHGRRLPPTPLGQITRPKTIRSRGPKEQGWRQHRALSAYRSLDHAGRRPAHDTNIPKQAAERASRWEI